MQFRFTTSLALIVVCSCTTTVSAQTATVEASSKLKLVWSDEFDGDSLDYSKWGVEQNAFGGGNNELQIFTDRPENVRVEKGNLILEAHKDNAGISGTVREYSSGRIRTKHRGDWIASSSFAKSTV